VDTFRPTGPQRLPVFLTAKLAFQNVFGNLRVFFTLATIPMVLTLICWLIGIVMLVVTLNNIGSGAGAFGFLISALAILFVSVVFIVAWHRFVITGTRVGGGRFQFAVGRREFRYLGAWLLLSVALGIPFGFFLIILLSAQGGQSGLPIVSWVLLALLTFIESFVWARLSLRFVAIAMDRDQGYAASWRQTRVQVCASSSPS